ncbi:PEGA domain protein [candidate division TM7 genomosp. GTL1]|nr:PEGA domain protein [candidate division TM7 genomosp. GTL1]
MHHNPRSKRRQVALRFFTYGVMTVAVVVISIICILFVLGYRFDQSSGRVEQRALLQLRSFPSNAAMTLDGSQLGFRTPGKRTVSAGKHSVVMKLDGYRDWRKDFMIQPGSLLWLNYARLIPASITTEEVRSLGRLVDIKASPDRRWLGFSTVASGHPQLSVGDISNEKEPKFSTLPLPKTLLKMKGGQLTLDEWDFGGRFILARHTVGNKTDFLQIDRTDPASARNITKQLKIPITDAHFAGTSGTTLFVLSDGDIRKIDLAAGTISRPLVSDVKDFMLYKSDLIAYVSVENGTQMAGFYKDGDKEPTVMRIFKGTSPQVHAVISSYFNDDYLAIAHGKSVEIIKDPTHTADRAGRVFAKFNFAPGIKWFNFSSNGRFVLAQKSDEPYKKQVLALVQDRLKTLADLPTLTTFLFTEPSVDWSLIENNKQLKKLSSEEIQSILSHAQQSFENSEFTPEALQQTLNHLLETTGQKPGVLFSLIRIVTTWAPFSPALNDTLALLGKQTTLDRIKIALAVENKSVDSTTARNETSNRQDTTS